MPDWLATRAQAKPHHLALILQQERLTYHELDLLCNIVAANLSEHGVKRGQHIAVLMHNSTLYVALIHAVFRLGAVLVPLNTRLTMSEIEWQLQHVHAAILVHDAEHEWAAPITTCPCLSSDTLTQTVKSPDLPAIHTHMDDVCLLMFTSGTSGKPKAVQLTYGNLSSSAQSSAERIGVNSADIWLCTLPLYHIGGVSIIVRSCLYGTAVSLHPKFELEAVLTDFVQYPITLISLVPTMLYRLLQDAPNPFTQSRSLRIVLLGGAAAQTNLIESAARYRITVATTYGLTEASSQVATALPDEVIRKVGTVGKPLRDTLIRIHNADSQGIGEIVVSAPTVMFGYYKDDIATQRTLHNGELITGDMGYVDSDGDLWVVQRRSDLIITGGENVYPSEVEAVLNQHPAIHEAIVVGIPDTEWGQKVVASIILKPDVNTTPDEIIRYCKPHLASYKLPRLIRFVNEFPLTASGKIHRAKIAEQLA